MNRLSNLSAGMLIALFTFGGMAFVIAFGGQQMFSPGPLNAQNRRGTQRGEVRSHAEIGSHCAACHASPLGAGTMSDRCLDCHADVRDAIASGKAMHGLLPNPLQCRNCHTEHQGHRGLLTTTLGQFNHDWAAFKLTGRHASTDCASCHRDQLYKGTPTACAACHAEPKKHLGRFGTDCASCHSTNHWATEKVGLFADFDHDRTRFPLTGKHRTTACASCHVNNTFKGTSSTCVSCHAEPQVHKGEFGTNCAGCHSTQTWTGASFRHTFPLSHGNATKKGGCAICHTTSNDFQSYTCYGCHRHEPNNTAKKHLKFGINDVKNCAACHPNARRKKKLAANDPVDVEPCAGQATDCRRGELTPARANPFAALVPVARTSSEATKSDEDPLSPDTNHAARLGERAWTGRWSATLSATSLREAWLFESALSPRWGSSPFSLAAREPRAK